MMVESRVIKVLMRTLDGAAEGHRAFVLAYKKNARDLIVLAATRGEGFRWGRLYHVSDEENRKHHPYVLEEVRGVPDELGWTIICETVEVRELKST